MDLADYRSKGSARRGRGTPSAPPAPQLFDDLSAQQQPYTPTPPAAQQQFAQPQFNPAYGGQSSAPNQFGPGAPQFLNDPMASMAMSYGQSVAGKGVDMAQRNIEKYVSTSKLKYYFAVDTSYVAHKLRLLVFPFTHTDWAVHYNDQEPVAPRYDVNAPDLYIPIMAFVTYLLTCGISLGKQNKFSPEQLGVQASSALVWLVLEVLLILATMYISAVGTQLKYLDLFSYCGYKYVGMILALLASLAGGSSAYYAALAYTAAALAFFLIRSLRVKVLSDASGDSYTGRGNKRRLYLLLSVVVLQPIFMWWLTAWVAR